MKKVSPRKKPSVLRPLAGLLLLLVSGLTAAWYFQWEPLRPAFLSVEVLLARLQLDMAQKSPQGTPAPSPPDGTKPAPAAPAGVPQPTDPKASPAEPDRCSAAEPTSPRRTPAPLRRRNRPPRLPPLRRLPPKPSPRRPRRLLRHPRRPRRSRRRFRLPWQAAFDAAGDVPDALTVCFDDFDLEHFLPQADDLKKWFEPVPGQRWTVTNSRTKFGEAATVDGLARLAMPWRDDVALRLAMEKLHGLRIHFLHGAEGLTLAYYERDQDNCWVAYAAQRKAGNVTPEEFALAADDEGRTIRSGFIRDGGTFELRYRDGVVTLSRGDIVLLRALLAGTPDEVYFEGKAIFCGIAAVRSSGFPAAVDARRPGAKKPGSRQSAVDRKADGRRAFRAFAGRLGGAGGGQGNGRRLGHHAADAGGDSRSGAGAGRGDARRRRVPRPARWRAARSGPVRRRSRGQTRPHQAADGQQRRGADAAHRQRRPSRWRPAKPGFGCCTAAACSARGSVATAGIGRSRIRPRRP